MFFKLLDLNFFVTLLLAWFLSKNLAHFKRVLAVILSLSKL